MSHYDFGANINLALSNEHNACLHICYKMYYIHQEIRDEQRFSTLKYYFTNKQLLVDLLKLNSNADAIIDIIEKANNFVENVTFEEFAKLFDDTLHIDYLKQKFGEMVNHPSYFLATRSARQYDNFINAVKEYHKLKN